MYIEITTGKDSFRARGAYTRRNVSVSAFVRVEDDGEGRKIIPLFAAYQKKLKGFRKKDLIAVIPATSSFGDGVAGEWYRTRYEVPSGTEILLEYRKRAPSGFQERVEHLLLIATEDAPLWQLRLDLPEHPLSAVPNVFTEGRFEIVDTDDKLTEKSVAAWRNYFDLDAEFEVSDILDPNQDERFWATIRLEAAPIRTKKAAVVKTIDGKQRVKIRRTRRLNIKK